MVDHFSYQNVDAVYSHYEGKVTLYFCEGVNPSLSPKICFEEFFSSFLSVFSHEFRGRIVILSSEGDSL